MLGLDQERKKCCKNLTRRVLVLGRQLRDARLGPLRQARRSVG
jgi:hypothetical protein